MGGSKEDTETCGHSSRTCARGLGDPLPVVSDGAPGVIRAIEECFPRSARQRCLAHRMRNLAVKVPTDLWSEFKAWAAACYQAPSRVIARELANGIRADYGAMLPSAISCFDTFGCRLPIAARRARQICLNVCSSRSRRRLKIIPNGFGEKPVLKLTFGALIRAAERWRGLRFTEFELRQIAAIRDDLDAEYDAKVIQSGRSSQPRLFQQIRALIPFRV
jgi:putative transposase